MSLKTKWLKLGEHLRESVRLLWCQWWWWQMGRVTSANSDVFSVVCPAELHEGDVQVPVEELWQGAEYHCWHSETHPHHPSGVRRRHTLDSRWLSFSKQQINVWWIFGTLTHPLRLRPAKRKRVGWTAIIVDRLRFVEIIWLHWHVCHHSTAVPAPSAHALQA